jgi:hypothetical protein
VDKVAHQRGTKAHTVIDRAPTKESTTTPLSAGLGLAFEWFLELPVWVVVLVLWVIGVALLGAGALVLYTTVWTLVG